MYIQKIVNPIAGINNANISNIVNIAHPADSSGAGDGGNICVILYSFFYAYFITISNNIIIISVY